MSFLSRLNIQSKQDFFLLVKQFVKFGLVGVSNTAIALAIYYAFIFINPALYVVGNTVAFVVSVSNSYFWNSRFVFNKADRGNVKPLLKTFVVYGCSFLLTTILLIVMVQYMDISKKIAPIINLLITIPLNFLFNKYWAMK